MIWRCLMISFKTALHLEGNTSNYGNSASQWPCTRLPTVLPPMWKFSFSTKSIGLRTLMVCEKISPAYTHCLCDDHHSPKSGTQISNMLPPFPIYITQTCGLGTEATLHLPFPSDLQLLLLQEILCWWLQICQVSWCWFCRKVFSQHLVSVLLSPNFKLILHGIWNNYLAMSTSCSNA